MRKESERANSIRDRHQDDALSRDVGAVIYWCAGLAECEAAAVDPHHHRQLLRRGLRRRPDVEIETVLAVTASRPRPGEQSLLHASGCERVDFLDAGPRHDWLRHLPALVANGRRGKGNAFEDADTTRRNAFHTAAVDCRRGHLRRSLSADRDDCENSACKQSYVSPHYVGPPSRCSVVRSNVINEFLVQRQADVSIADVSITHCFVASVRNPGTFSSAKAQVRFRGNTSTQQSLIASDDIDLQQARVP